jgi:hypothetical protein
MFLLLGKAALLVPAVIIKLTRRIGGMEREGFERENLKGLFLV